MQNILVSHNCLSSAACTRRALFGLERGAWGGRWDGGAGDVSPAPVPGTALLSELHRPVVLHLLLHLPHCILLLTMRPWCVVAFVTPLQCCHTPAEPGTHKTGHGPAACNHPCSELVTTGSPKLLLAWGKPPTDVEHCGQQDLPYWPGPRGIAAAEMTVPMPQGCKCPLHSTLN